MKAILKPGTARSVVRPLDMKAGEIGVINPGWGESFEGHYVIRGGDDKAYMLLDLSQPCNHWENLEALPDECTVTLLSHGQEIVLTVE